MTPLLISTLTTAGAAVLADLTAYANALGKHTTDPILYPIRPAFEWRLFTARFVIGAITGALIGLGINTGLSSPVQGGT